jgi:hypothetical protein
MRVVFVFYTNEVVLLEEDLDLVSEGLLFGGGSLLVPFSFGLLGVVEEEEEEVPLLLFDSPLVKS